MSTGTITPKRSDEPAHQDAAEAEADHGERCRAGTRPSAPRRTPPAPRGSATVDGVHARRRRRSSARARRRGAARRSPIRARTRRARRGRSSSADCSGRIESTAGDAHPGLERRRLLLPRHRAARRAPGAARRSHRGGARARPLRRLQLADARPAADGAARGQRLSTSSTARPPTACTSRSPGCSTSCPTWWSPASTSAPTWATTPSTPAPSRRRPRASCSAFPSIAVSLASKDGRAFRDRGARGACSWWSASARAPFGAAGAAQRQRARRAAAGARRLEVTRLGRRHKAEPVVKMQHAARRDRLLDRRRGRRGRTPGRAPTSTRSRRGRVSVTPLQVDLTLHAQMPHGAGVAGPVSAAATQAQRHRHDLAAHARAHGRAPARAGHPRRAACSRRWAAVPRHLFVDEALASRAYEDTALPIGFGQTISQPYVVARMIEVLRAGPRARARCWRSAPAAATRRRCWRRLAREVYSIERIQRAARARARESARAAAVQPAAGARRRRRSGWKRRRPSTRSSSPRRRRELPQALLRQLAPGGRMMLPLRSPARRAARSGWCCSSAARAASPRPCSNRCASCRWRRERLDLGTVRAGSCLPSRWCAAAGCGSVSHAGAGGRPPAARRGRQPGRRRRRRRARRARRAGPGPTS